MAIGHICNRELTVTTPETTIADAAKLMRNHHVGTLVVVKNDDRAQYPVGIITDRDLVVEIMAMDLDPHTLTVGEVMGPALVTAGENDDIRETLERMRRTGMRRLPIMSTGGRLLGIVASDDLIQWIAEDMAALASIATREYSREAAQRRSVPV